MPTSTPGGGQPSAGPPRRRLYALLLLAAVGWIWLLNAEARVELSNAKLEAEYWGGVTTDDGSAALSRFTVKPSARWRLGDGWQLEVVLRGEYASDDTGLGSLETYSDLSRPFVDNTRSRLELDRATLVFRSGPTVLTLGKQTVPWGLLDGIQITDRFDAVRRRDFVLTDIRPDRLARWGFRLRSEASGWRVDTALLLDPTVSQQPAPGTAFSPRAARLRGGLPATAPDLPVRVSDRESYTDDATFGLRLARTLGGVDVSVLSLRGPDTEPLLVFATDSAGPYVELEYPRRSLHGFTLERGQGGNVWRVELAYVPDQPVNIRAPEPFAKDERRRWLAGVGLDWNAPAGWFVNAQLALDRINRGSTDITRPTEDVIGTLRVQRGFRQETWRVRGELLGALSDGDGVFRPALDWRGHDHLTITLGADLLFGDRDGLFGQYQDESRAWIRLSLSL